MVFLAISAIALSLLALAAGAALLSAGEGKPLVKLVALLVIVASVLAAACAAYHGVVYRQAGLFEAKVPAQEMGGGMKCPMMEKMKQGAESQGHEGHH